MAPDVNAVAVDDAAVECAAYLSMTDALNGVRYIVSEHQSGRVTNRQAMLWLVQAAGYAIEATRQPWPWLDETTLNEGQHHGI